jgi:hypothetical protein
MPRFESALLQRRVHCEPDFLAFLGRRYPRSSGGALKDPVVRGVGAALVAMVARR